MKKVDEVNYYALDSVYYTVSGTASDGVKKHFLLTPNSGDIVTL
jgi:uncharacterized protein YpmB